MPSVATPVPAVQVPSVEIPKRQIEKLAHVPTHEEWRKVYRGSKPRKENLDRQPTAKELLEADMELTFEEGMNQRIHELREDILQGRVKATKQRKKELGFLPETKVRAIIPKKGVTINATYTKGQFEKYLETARRLDEQKKERIAHEITDVMKVRGDGNEKLGQNPLRGG